MKKVLLIIFVLSSVALGQMLPGKIEFSASATGGSYSTTVKFNGENNESESLKYFVLALRTGYYLNKNFEIEPEFIMTATEGNKPIFSISGNIVYNIDIQQSNIKPFILAGYGIGNSIPLLNVVLERSTPEFDITHFNVGSGIKIFVSKSAAIRVEYRYQQFEYEKELDNYYLAEKQTIKYSVNTNKLLFGVSVFF